VSEQFLNGTSTGTTAGRWSQGRMSGPQRRRVAENSAGSGNTVLARAATSTSDDVDLNEWPILDAWDTILANQSTYDSTAAVTQTE